MEARRSEHENLLIQRDNSGIGSKGITSSEIFEETEQVNPLDPEIKKRLSRIYEINPADLVLVIEEVLRSHNIRIQKTDSATPPTQLPSMRLNPSTTFVFPGSKYKYKHDHYLCVTEKNVLEACYAQDSKMQSLSDEDKTDLLMKVLDVNARETLAIWKVEERPGYCFPVMELTLYIRPEDKNGKKAIWSNCAQTDVHFKTQLPYILASSVSGIPEVGAKLMNFLQNKGFRKIKESTLPSGLSYLVILSSDEEPESCRWKRFPLMIEVTGCVCFRVFFSLNDAAVVARNAFARDAKVLIAKLNGRFAVGYYNYSSGSNQIQYVLKLHYKTLTKEDFGRSLASYYDTCVVHYKWTVAAFDALHERTINLLESLNESDITEDDRINEEMQNPIKWIKVGVAKTAKEEEKAGTEVRQPQENPRKETKIDINLLEKLTSNPKLADYFLPPPVFKLKEKKEETWVFVRFSSHFDRSLSLLTHLPYDISAVIESLMTLVTALKSVDVYPTMDMLYHQIYTPTKLIIIPDVGLHTDLIRFENDALDFALKLPSRSKFTMSIRGFEVDYSIKFEDFDRLRRVEGYEDIAEMKLGDVRHLLYRLKESPENHKFRVLFEQYKSLLNRIGSYPNPLQGWTEANSDFIMNMPRTSLGNQFFFMCEEYKLAIWNGTDPIPTLIQVGKYLQSLHKRGYCHLFLSPLTIRQDSRTHTTVIVLPSCIPTYFKLIHSFIPRQMAGYIAPETYKCLQEGEITGNMDTADVFSLCTVIAGKMTQREGAIRDLATVVNRGISENPRERPLLSEVITALEQYQDRVRQ